MLVHSETGRNLHWPQHTPFPGGPTRVCWTFGSALGPIPSLVRAGTWGQSFSAYRQWTLQDRRSGTSSLLDQSTEQTALAGESLNLLCDTSSSHSKSQTPLTSLSDSCQGVASPELLSRYWCQPSGHIVTVFLALGQADPSGETWKHLSSALHSGFGLALAVAGAAAAVSTDEAVPATRWRCDLVHQPPRGMFWWLTLLSHCHPKLLKSGKLAESPGWTGCSDMVFSLPHTASWV